MRFFIFHEEIFIFKGKKTVCGLQNLLSQKCISYDVSLFSINRKKIYVYTLSHDLLLHFLIIRFAMKECDMMREITILTRDASHLSAVRMCMVITLALLIGQCRRGLLIKTQTVLTIRLSCYPIYDRIRTDVDVCALISSSYNHSFGH